MKKIYLLLLAMICSVGMGWAAPVTGSSTVASQGSFTYGYDYSFSTNGTDVTITFTSKEDYVGLVAYFWDYTNGFAESGMTVSGQTATKTLTNQTAGTTLKFACKFAFAGGMSVTEQFTYTVEAASAGGEEEPEEPVVNTFTIYYYKTNDWTDVYAHTWEDNGASATWPGTKMTAVEGKAGWYSAEVIEGYNRIIFNDGAATNAQQTGTLVIPTKNRYYAYGEFVRHIRGIDGDWNNAQEWTSFDGKVLSFAMTLNAYTQRSFKFHHATNSTDNDWYGNAGVIDHNANFTTWWDMNANADIVLRSGMYAGSYTFKYNVETKRFCVDMPSTENRTLKKGNHVITLTPEYLGYAQYRLTISSEETLSNLTAGCYWNVNGAGTQMTADGHYTVNTADNTIVCEVVSTQAPNIYTPLYILMPSEVNFGNIALEWINAGPAASASVEAGANKADQAIDGNTGTRWESTGVDDAWWMIDYQAPKQFNNIQIVWEGAYGKSFDILGSNTGEDGDWTVVSSVRDQVLEGFPYTQTIELTTPVTYRYVKFQGIARGTGYGYSFYEFNTFYRNVNILTTYKFSSGIARFIKLNTEVNLDLQTLNQYGEHMDVTTEYTVTPASAGSFINGNFKVESLGDFTITATSGEKNATVKICGVESDNIALNKTANAGINAAGAGASNNGNAGDRWGSNGATHPDQDWWYVDLGALYNISVLAIKWETACPNNYDIKVSEDGENWTIAKTYTEYPISGNGSNDFNVYNDFSDVQARYIGVWAHTGYENLAYGISIFEFNVYGKAVPTYELNVSSHGWASLCLPKAYKLPAGVTAYYASSANASAVTLKKIEDNIIPAQEGVVVEAAEGTYSLTETTSEADYENLFEGSYNGATTVTASTVYVLSAESDPDNVIFGLYTGTEMPAYKAYLPVANVPATSAGAQGRISFVFDQTDTATAVENAETETAVKFFENGQFLIKKNGVVYTVMGQIVR